MEPFTDAGHVSASNGLISVLTTLGLRTQSSDVTKSPCLPITRYKCFRQAGREAGNSPSSRWLVLFPTTGLLETPTRIALRECGPHERVPGFSLCQARGFAAPPRFLRNHPESFVALPRLTPPAPAHGPVGSAPIGSDAERKWHDRWTCRVCSTLMANAAPQSSQPGDMRWFITPISFQESSAEPYACFSSLQFGIHAFHQNPEHEHAQLLQSDLHSAGKSFGEPFVRSYFEGMVKSRRSNFSSVAKRIIFALDRIFSTPG